MIRERCDTCRFWELDGEGKIDKEHGYEDNDRQGVCRRYPPVHETGYFATQPLTVNFEWCGEWKPKDAEPVPPS